MVEEVEEEEEEEEETSNIVVNWDGEVIDRDKPWIDEEAFTIGDLSVTNQDLVVTSSSTFIIIGIVCAVLAFISYRKRKAIATEARRASQFLGRLSVRVTHNIRKSFAGRVQDENDKNDDGMHIPRGVNRRQKNFLTDLF